MTAWRAALYQPIHACLAAELDTGCPVRRQPPAAASYDVGRQPADSTGMTCRQQPAATDLQFPPSVPPIGGGERTKATCGTPAEGRTAVISSSANSDRPTAQRSPPPLVPQGRATPPLPPLHPPRQSSYHLTYLAAVFGLSTHGVSHASISCV